MRRENTRELELQISRKTTKKVIKNSIYYQVLVELQQCYGFLPNVMYNQPGQIKFLVPLIHLSLDQVNVTSST